jgi:hypothetical protein
MLFVFNERFSFPKKTKRIKKEEGKLYCFLIFILISIHFISCHATVEFFFFGACVVLETEVHATHFNLYKVYLQIELEEIFFNPIY